MFFPSGRYHREADRVRERRAVLREEERGGWSHSPVDGVREAVPERGTAEPLPRETAQAQEQAVRELPSLEACKTPVDVALG